MVDNEDKPVSVPPKLSPFQQEMERNERVRRREEEIERMIDAMVDLADRRLPYQDPNGPGPPSYSISYRKPVWPWCR
tara:strand:+ start:479 stop:709 length:231 start_codon:yes stop_codon:yes gene_type:complete